MIQSLWEKCVLRCAKVCNICSFTHGLKALISFYCFFSQIFEYLLREPKSREERRKALKKKSAKILEADASLDHKEHLGQYPVISRDSKVSHDISIH